MVLKISAIYKKILKDKNFFEVLKGSILTFLIKIFTVLLGMISNFIIAKYYGSEVMGVISILFSIMGISSIFSLIGTNVSILRFVPPLVKQNNYTEIVNVIKKIFLIVFFSGLISSLVVYSSSEFIATHLFQKSFLGTFIALISFFIFSQAIGNISLSTIRALNKIKSFLILQFLPSLVNLIVLVCVTFLFFNQYNPLYSQLFAQFLTTVISFIIILKFLAKYKYTGINIGETSYREIISVSSPMFLTAIMQSVITQTDIFMLGSLANVSDVGVYSIVMKLALLSSFIITSLNTFMAPKFSELFYNNELDELKNLAQKSTKLIFYVTLPITIIMVVFGNYLLSIFGDEFIGGYYALLLLSIGQLINAASGSIGYLLNMTGHQKQFNKIVLLGALINIIVNYLLIPLYGINGAAFASMLSVIFWNIMASVYSKRYLGFYMFYVPKLKRN